MEQVPFIEFARFYLPGLLPIVVVVSLVIARFPIKLWIALIIVAIVVGSSTYLHIAGFYNQAAEQSSFLLVDVPPVFLTMSRLRDDRQQKLADLLNTQNLNR